MMKTLSIIVPTYNMESLVGICLDSVLGATLKERIQIVAVNDGSRDGSLEILRQAERQHPGSVTVVDKPNGNYGSAINAGLARAEGRYVRILDADDRYDTAELDAFVGFLDTIPETDMVVGPYAECSAGKRKVIGPVPYSGDAYEYGRIFDADQVFGDGRIPFLAMHSTVYRTELLRRCAYRQTEGMSYTDQEWVFMPLFHITGMAFYPRPVYLYNTSREGQTMSPDVQMRSIGQMTAVTLSMAGYYLSHPFDSEHAVRERFLRSVLERRFAFILRKYLLEMNREQFASADFASVISSLREAWLKCGIDNLKVYPNPRLRFDLLSFWEHNHRRPSPQLLAALRLANRAMYRVYDIVYR